MCTCPQSPFGDGSRQNVVLVQPPFPHQGQSVTAAQNKPDEYLPGSICKLGFDAIQKRKNSRIV